MEYILVPVKLGGKVDDKDRASWTLDAGLVQQ